MNRIFGLLFALMLTSCTKPCGENEAMNKMLALNSVQARLVSKGGESGMALSARMAVEAAPVGELIAQKKYGEACAKADEMAAKYEMNLANEQKDMITYEQLKKDGGKGSGTCSIADAAKKQMELHGLLQAEVNAGKRSSDIFREFNEDTKGYAEMLSTDPSKACELFDRLREKYGV